MNDPSLLDILRMVAKHIDEDSDNYPIPPWRLQELVQNAIDLIEVAEKEPVS